MNIYMYIHRYMYMYMTSQCIYIYTHDCFYPSLFSAGISTLDIRTRLRISEAELAIVQREVADLLTEKNTLETNAKGYEESWKFAIQVSAVIYSALFRNPPLLWWERVPTILSLLALVHIAVQAGVTVT